MRDLTDVLGAAVEARAQALGGLAPASGLAGLRTRVRRRRAVRHTVEAVAVLPIVAAIGVGGWLLLGDRNPVPPVVSPSPTSTPTEPAPDPTPTPTPSATPTPEVVLGDPIDEPGVPTYYAMPGGLLDAARPGWVLATYQAQPLPYADAPPAFSADELVFLVRPDGTRFLVTRIPPSDAVDGDGNAALHHDLLAWEAGATTAVVREVAYMGASEGPVMTLDLLTGTLTAGVADPTRGGSPNSRGDLWLTVDDSQVASVVDAAGTRLATVDRSTETSSGWCEAVAWWTADSVLAVCLSHDPSTWNDGGSALLDLEPRLVTFDVGKQGLGQGTVLRPLGPGDAAPWEWGSANAGDGLVVAQGTALEPGAVWSASCPTGVYLIGTEGTERLPASDSHPDVELNIFESTVVGRTVFVESTGGCSGDIRPSLLTSYELDTHAFTELVGPPPRAGAATYPWMQGLTSYVVGS